MKLRPYQERVHAETVQALNQVKRVLLQLPTGGGKTVLFNHIAYNDYVKAGKRVLIIADRRELINQAATKFHRATGMYPGIIMSEVTPYYSAAVQVASIQTLNRRFMPQNIGLVVIDECRGSVSNQYKEVFNYYKDSHILGVDATPIRTNGAGFEHLYYHMVKGPSIREMESMGALVPASIKINPIDKKALSRVSITAGDYNESELGRVMSDKRLTADLVESKLKWAPGLLTMVFAVNLEHSKMIVEQYKEAGISAVHVDGDTPTTLRDKIFKDFEQGKYEVLCNVGIACYGTDIPAIRCIQLARPTKSLSLYLQQCGRGGRPNLLPDGSHFIYPDGNRKENYILLDHANCWYEFGLPNADRKWSLKPTKKHETRPRQMRIKLPTGEEKTIRGELPEYVKGVELIEVTEEDFEMMDRLRDLEKIIEYAKKRRYRNSYAWYEYSRKMKYEIPDSDLQHIAQRLGFSDTVGWAKHAKVFLNKQLAAGSASS